MLNANALSLVEHVAETDEQVAAHLRSGLERMDRRNAARGMDRIIGKAFENGAKRGARDIDVFVHHLEPFLLPKCILGYEMIARGYQPSVMQQLQLHLAHYQALLLDAIDDGARPIAIASGLDEPDWADEVVEPRLRLASGETCTSLLAPGDTFANGYLDEEEFTAFVQLTGGLHAEDRIRVHGAYAGACVIQFATQLAAVRLFGQHQVAPFAERQSEFLLTADEARAMGDVWRDERLYEASGNRIGRAFDRHSAVSVPSIADIIGQMSDVHTVIVPKA